MKCLRIALVVAVLSVMAPFVRSALAAKVGLVTTSPGDRFVTKLAQELEQLGFEVVREGTLQARTDEVAIIRVSGAEIELYEVRPDGALGNKTSLSVANNDPLKSAEQVHAFLLPPVEKAAPSPPPPASPPPVPPVPIDAGVRAIEAREASERARGRPSTVELSGGASAFFGGLDPGLSVSAAGAYFPRSLRAGSAMLGFSLGGTIAVVPERVSSVEGSTTLRAFLGGPQVVGRRSFSRATSAEVGVGAWVHHVRVSGSSNAPFTSKDDSAWSWSPVARLRLRYDVAASFGLYAEAIGGVSLPAIAVRFAGNEVDAWGRPWTTAGAGLVVAF